MLGKRNERFRLVHALRRAGSAAFVRKLTTNPLDRIRRILVDVDTASKRYRVLTDQRLQAGDLEFIFHQASSL